MKFSSQDSQNKNTTGKSARVLIPVDFSRNGDLPVRVGFELARRLEQSVTLIHASVVAEPMIVPQFPDDFNGMDNENSEIEEVEMSEEVHEIDEKSMHSLEEKIRKLQKAGNLPDIDFNSVISPGMPEEVISEYCTANPPSVIVMATRGKDKRQEEMIGSVTVEVIDHSIAPVFTVPETYTFTGFKNIVRICAFCNMDSDDQISVRKLMAMFHNPSVTVYLFPANDKLKAEALNASLSELRNQLAAEFPNSIFKIAGIDPKGNKRAEAEKFFVEEDIQMILVANKKRNALLRLFHPGMAHKILFEIDFPMLAIPV